MQAGPHDTVVRFPVSRLVVDLGRFPDDDQEPMANVGMGVIYTQTTQEKPLRHEPSPQERERLLKTWYRPHHARLEAAARTELARHGRVLIIDCHSFPSKRLRHEPDRSEDRPDICLGTDSFHTPPELTDTLAAAFESLGYTVKRDSPFAGAIVPSIYYRKEPRVASIMVELNRRLYMDEETGVRTTGFERTCRRIPGPVRGAASRNPW